MKKDIDEEKYIKINTTIIDIENIMLNIKKDLYESLGGYTSSAFIIFNSIQVKDIDYISNQIYIKLDLIAHNVTVIIPNKYCNDKKFIQHAIMFEICKYIEICYVCLERIKKISFPYQHKLVKQWEEENKNIEEDIQTKK